MQLFKRKLFSCQKSLFKNRGKFKILSNIYVELFCKNTLRKNCPYSEFFSASKLNTKIRTRKTPSTDSFLVSIFRHLDWIQRDTDNLSIFNPNVGKCGPEKLLIRTLFTQCNCSASVGSINPLLRNKGLMIAVSWSSMKGAFFVWAMKRMLTVTFVTALILTLN